MGIDPAQIIVARYTFAAADIFHQLFAQGGDEPAVCFVILFPVLVNAVFGHVFPRRLEEIGADEGAFVTFFQFKVQIPPQNPDLMAETGLLPVGGMDLFLFLHPGEEVVCVAEIAFPQRPVNIGKLRDLCEPFAIMGEGQGRDVPRRIAVIFHLPHGFLRIEQHPRRHLVQDRDQFPQTLDRLFADDLFVAFAQNDGAGVAADHADDGAGFIKRIDRGQLRLNVDPQFIAGIVERLRRAPGMAADEVEPGGLENPQFVQVFFLVKMGIAGLRKITVFRHAPEVDGLAVDQQIGPFAADDAGRPLPRDAVHGYAVALQFQADRIQFRRPVAPASQICGRGELHFISLTNKTAGGDVLSVFVRDLPEEIHAVCLDRFHVPVWGAVFAGKKAICDPCGAGDLQGNAAADPGAFGLIALCRQTAMLARAGTECNSVMGFVHPVIGAAVVMHIADHDDEFIFLLRQQQPGQIEVRCGGVAGHISGELSVAENAAAPHGGSHGQNGVRIFFKNGGDDLPVVAASDEKRTRRVRREGAAHREMGFAVIRVEPGGQTEKIFFIKEFIMIVPIAGRDHFPGVLFCLWQIMFSGFKLHGGIEKIPFAVQGDVIWIHRVAFRIC